MREFDLAVIGGGLAGCTLALHVLKLRPETNIIVVDKRSFPLSEGVGTVGESTVEIASHYLADVLGLKEHLEQAQLPKLGLRYFLESDNNLAIENRLEVGGNKFAPTPSYQIDRSRLENFLQQELLRLGASFIEQSRVKEAEIDKQGHTLRIYSDKGEQSFVKAKWLVDASGRTSVLKKKLGLQKDFDHDCSSAWWRMDGEFKVDEWCKEPCWGQNNQGQHARWFSTNHLMGKGYWVWIIPLASGHTSFGIVTDSNIHPFNTYNTFERALSWLEQHEPQLAALCKKHAETLKDFAGIKNYSYSCKQVFSPDRWALTGEAGLFVDPFYSPGSDFIAFSNTYIADLITRELSGEAISMRCEIYNELYLRFAEATIKVYKNQYSILGNPLVTPLKVYWDWCFYWHFMGRIFFRGKLCDLRFASKYRSTFERLHTLSSSMQNLFNRWNELERPKSKAGFLDLGRHPFLSELNRSLRNFDAPAEELFEKGVSELEGIAVELVRLFESRTGEKFDLEIELTAFKDREVVVPFFEDMRSFLDAA